MNALYQIVCSINSTLSDYVLITLLVITGIVFTIRTRFVQVRCLGTGFKRMFSDFSIHGKMGGTGISSLQALFTAIAAQVGTGNIVGASGAILTGGPGAIFWMWIIAFLGMATIYAEAVLAQETRIKLDENTIHGGPIYYIKRAFDNAFGKFIACFFAVSTILSLGLIGVMVQANSVGEVCQNALNVPSWGIGIVVAILSALVFIGGLSRIARVTEKLVPLMAVLYLLGGLILLIVRIRFIPETILLIFKYAFDPQALIGGGVGYALKMAISQGVKRGLFSNEAGMGSTPHAHAMANVDRPHTQGVAAMVGVFIDTFVVLTMTALIVISTIYVGDGPLAGATGANYSELLASAGLQKTNLVQIAFASVSNANVGNLFVAVCLIFFAFSTILGWHFFGRINFEYLFGRKCVLVYAFLSVLFVFLGTVVKNDLVWELQDMFNQLMVLPNVLALIALSSLVAKSARQSDK